MPIVGGLDIHRKQITFDYLDTATGQVRRGRLAAVAARDMQNTTRFAARVVDTSGLARVQVDGVDAAMRADRVRAAARAGELTFLVVKVGLGNELVPRPLVVGGSGAMATVAAVTETARSVLCARGRGFPGWPSEPGG